MSAVRPDADDEAVLDEVASRLSAEGTVAAALGGSLGRGDATPTSDLDVLAVLAEGAEDRFRRLLLHGRLVEVVGRTEAGWLAHLDSERPRWIYSLMDRVVVLFDDEGAFQRIQQRAIEVMRSFRVSDEVKGELATLLWHSRSKLARAARSTDVAEQGYWAALVLPTLIDGLLALHDRPTAPGSMRLPILADVDLDPTDRSLIDRVLTANPLERLSAATSLADSLQTRLGPPDLERIDW
jgi:predicted nucleotidyltransferase